MSLAHADDLIDQARSLVESDPRRPRQANLRRAVSSAYYALFHEVVNQCVLRVLGAIEAKGKAGHRLRRTINHADIKLASQWIRRTKNPMPVANILDAAGPPPPGLAVVCRRFIDLNRERHRADYDLAKAFSRPEARRRVVDAKEAVTEARNLRTSPSIHTTVFLLGCLFGEKYAKSP